jgi:hypothetical protein
MRRHFFLPIASIVFMLAIGQRPVAAQTLIRLHVLSDTTARPVAGAIVTLGGTFVRATTNDSGWTSLTSPFVGYHKLVISELQHKTVDLGGIDFDRNETLTIEVAMPKGDPSIHVSDYGSIRGPLPQDQIIRLTPGLIANGGISVHGDRGTSNSIIIKGNDITDPLSGRTAPLTNTLSRLAVSEVGITTHGSDVALGGFIGGIMRTGLNAEEYQPIHENGYHGSQSEPLSTFSIDVDVASYGNMRRFLMRGEAPPADAVRVEELINYFTYDYPEPTNGRPFSVTTDAATCPWNPKHQIVSIGLQAKHISNDNLPPANLVFLIDVSGSMYAQAKLPLLKQAFRLLVGQLRPQDHVAIVTYAGHAGVVLECTSGSEKDKILAVINNLEAGGSTAGAEGIITAYEIAKDHYLGDGNNRVVLATDGDFNVGVSGDAELVRMMEDKRKDGIYLSILGFGTENYKDSKMEQIADKGNGNYAYIEICSRLRKYSFSSLAGRSTLSLTT